MHTATCWRWRGYRDFSPRDYRDYDDATLSFTASKSTICSARAAHKMPTSFTQLQRLPCSLL